MKLVVFGLAVSSSWESGHATHWRGLGRALAAAGHSLTFFERELPSYAAHRDLETLPGGTLHRYPSWAEVRPAAEAALADADAAMVTSSCPDGPSAATLVLRSPARVRVFYDLDTPVTLARLRAGQPVEYLGPRRLAGFDLALSFTGGPTLDAMVRELGARRALPLYGSVDPEVHRPVRTPRRADLSYLGTYAAERQIALERLLMGAARALPQRRFLVGGAEYPAGFPGLVNVEHLPHVAPPEHAAFYSSAPLTLNLTRSVMAEAGWCPSGRLFEAAASRAAIISDDWPGLTDFFEPGREILIARRAGDVIQALARPPAELERIASAGRVRVLAQHTAAHRAAELVRALATV
jgi:spore maturation protein CgeB